MVPKHREEMSKLLVKLVAIHPESQDPAIELAYTIAKVAADFVASKGHSQLAEQIVEHCNEQLDRAWMEGLGWVEAASD
jgi:hypothetical protein